MLWLKGNAVVAAFEIESTTSIYSGLLRMADLIAMQPNLNIPLYLVAPDERRQKVFAEVNRPTFSRLSPPLVELCRFVPSRPAGPAWPGPLLGPLPQTRVPRRGLRILCPGRRLTSAVFPSGRILRWLAGSQTNS